jgi:predicted membrane protein
MASRLHLIKIQRMDQQPIRKRKFLAVNTFMGVLFLLIGTILFMRQSGYPFPPWLFTWPMILITVGVLIGIRHRFRDFSWLFMIIVGMVFLSDEIWPTLNLRHYTVPVIFGIIGLVFIFSPKHRGPCQGRNRMRARMRERYYRYHPELRDPAIPVTTDNTNFEAAAPPAGTKDTIVDVVSVFSGIKKKILSKQFAGGDIVCIFGGSEINLTNADFVSPITLELTQVFGGTKLVVPGNWEIRSEIAAIFGEVDDKRPQPVNAISEKTIILKGTVIFGGVEVNSY